MFRFPSFLLTSPCTTSFECAPILCFLRMRRNSSLEAGLIGTEICAGCRHGGAALVSAGHRARTHGSKVWKLKKVVDNLWMVASAVARVWTIVPLKRSPEHGVLPMDETPVDQDQLDWTRYRHYWKMPSSGFPEQFTKAGDRRNSLHSYIVNPSPFLLAHSQIPLW